MVYRANQPARKLKIIIMHVSVWGKEVSFDTFIKLCLLINHISTWNKLSGSCNKPEKWRVIDLPVFLDDNPSERLSKECITHSICVEPIVWCKRAVRDLNEAWGNAADDSWISQLTDEGKNLWRTVIHLMWLVWAVILQKAKATFMFILHFLLLFFFPTSHHSWDCRLRYSLVQGQRWNWGV